MKIKLAFEITNNDESAVLLSINGVTDLDPKIPETDQIAEDVSGTELYIAAIEVLIERLLPTLKAPSIN